MPRTSRTIIAGGIYHVFSRANRGLRVFGDPAAAQRFVQLMREATERVPLRLLAYCVMPTHFHDVIESTGDGDIGRWMQWLLTRHVRLVHAAAGTWGRIWQGRYKAFPIQSDRHLVTVLRYVERNPVRAGLVEKAEDWPASSASAIRVPGAEHWLAPWPIERPADWLERVSRPETPAELEAMRTCLARNRPYGSAEWVLEACRRHGLASSLRPRGRPAKEKGTVPFSGASAEKGTVPFSAGLAAAEDG